MKKLRVVNTVMFLNLSNHSYETWSENQKNAAKEHGEIVDYPFPAVDPMATKQEIEQLAENVVREVVDLAPKIIMCQGEFTLTYRLVKKLQEAGFLVVSACSERNTTIIQREDGSTVKQIGFEFQQFREY